MAASQATRPAADAVDHLLLGTRDLDAGIEWVAKRFGVKAAVGGSHPGRGTRNALIAFRRRRYLEIIAPDPAQPPENLTRDLRALDEPRLIAWASASGDLGALAEAAPGTRSTSHRPSRRFAHPPRRAEARVADARAASGVRTGRHRPDSVLHSVVARVVSSVTGLSTRM